MRMQIQEAAVLVRPRVLVVDDTPDVRETISDLLQDRDFETMTAADGRAALEVLRRGPRPDVILLDLMMVGMDGLMFLEQQRADPAIADIPVIVMTALRPRGSKLQDFPRVLLKPFKVEALLAEIEAAGR